MWIRSQNRGRLLNANHVFINSDNEIIACNEEGDIYNDYMQMTHSRYVLGGYKDKERAMEILDDIQYNIVQGNRIYQMPKE